MEIGKRSVERTSERRPPSFCKRSPSEMAVKYVRIVAVHLVDPPPQKKVTLVPACPPNIAF